MIIKRDLKNNNMKLDFLKNQIFDEDPSTAEANPCND